MALLSNLLMMFACTMFASTAAIKELDTKREVAPNQIEQVDQNKKDLEDRKPTPLGTIPMPIGDQKNSRPLPLGTIPMPIDDQKDSRPLPLG